MDSPNPFEDLESRFSSRKEGRAQRKRARQKDTSKYKKTDKDKHARLLAEKTHRRLTKSAHVLRGRVLALFPEGIVVQTADPETILTYTCTLKGTLKKEFSLSKNLVAVGDWVLFEPEGESQGAITHIEPRQSFLSRQENLHRRQEQLIAANIDQVFITLSVGTPSLKPGLIDRYLLSTYKGNMTPVLVINKIDVLVPGSAEEALFRHVYATYTHLGLLVYPVSVRTGEGMEALRQQMQGKASVFSGQSGVGKSSLINAMTGLTLPTGDLTRKTHKGVHTTTSAQLIPLSGGGWCIDTPGIRSFGVWNLEKADLAAVFPELSPQVLKCAFPNCTHDHEPGCGAQEALTQEKISPYRLHSYHALLQEIDTPTRPR